MQPVGQVTGVQAQVALLPEAGGGTRVEMHCFYLDKPGYHGDESWHISLFVYPRGGGKPGPPVAVWDVKPGTDVSVSGVTRLPRDQIDHLELQLANGTELLTYPVA
jgi:hypothetical protein